MIVVEKKIDYSAPATPWGRQTSLGELIGSLYLLYTVTKCRYDLEDVVMIWRMSLKWDNVHVPNLTPTSESYEALRYAQLFSYLTFQILYLQGITVHNFEHKNPALQYTFEQYLLGVYLIMVDPSVICAIKEFPGVSFFIFYCLFIWRTNG